MSKFNHPGSILPQFNELSDDPDLPGAALPFSEVEVQELLFGDDRPAADRIARLTEFRDELLGRQSVDFFDDDARSLLGEINDAIAQLRSDLGEADAETDLPFDDTIVQPYDPTDHRELLSPDDDVLEDIEAEDEESVEDDIGEIDDEDVLDPEEWDDEADESR